MPAEEQLKEEQSVTEANSGQQFLRGPVVVQCGRDAKSQKRSAEVKEKLSHAGNSKCEILTIPGTRGVTIFHRGNVIAGPRVQTFVDYIDKITRKTSAGG